MSLDADLKMNIKHFLIKLLEIYVGAFVFSLYDEKDINYAFFSWYIYVDAIYKSQGWSQALGYDIMPK
jgi:hypothetical protein